MTNVKPNMDCENCWLIVNEFDGDYACDECVSDALATADTKRDLLAILSTKLETA